MVGIYFKTSHIPVRFLIYVAITALTRMLIELVSETNKLKEGILVVVGGIVLLFVAVLILHFGSYKYRYSDDGDGSGDKDRQQK